MKTYLWISVVFLPLSALLDAQETIPTVMTLKGEKFTNVRVVGKSGNRVKIIHSDGVKTIIISELSDSEGAKLGGPETLEQAEVRRQKEAKAKEAYRQELEAEHAAGVRRLAALQAEVEQAEWKARMKALDEASHQARLDQQRAANGGLTNFQKLQRDNAEREAETRARVAYENARQQERFRAIERLNKLKKELTR